MPNWWRATGASEVRLLAVALLIAALLQGCSEPARPTIVGHWRAENFQMQGLGLPIGPELDITDKELAVSGTDIRVPVERVAFKDKEVTLSFPLGVSLSFHVESASRMFVDLPMIGPIYYQKVPATVAGTPEPARDAAPATPVRSAAVAPLAPPANATNPGAAADKPPAPPAATTAGLGAPRDELVKFARTSLARGNLNEAGQALAQLATLDARYPPLLLEQAALAAALSDADAAIRYLDSALKAGFRPVSAIESDPRLAMLQSDSRFKALTARYR